MHKVFGAVSARVPTPDVEIGWVVRTTARGFFTILDG